VNVTKKRARAVIPGDRLVFRAKRGNRVWHERVIGVVHAPMSHSVRIRTHGDGVTVSEMELDGHAEVEVVSG